jgi:excisionase family DNA binding protein
MSPATLSVEQAAKRLGVDPQTLYRVIRKGATPIPSIRIGRSIRIPAAPLDHFLATGTWPAPALPELGATA